jgi:hypothetical protein
VQRSLTRAIIIRVSSCQVHLNRFTIKVYPPNRIPNTVNNNHSLRAKESFSTKVDMSGLRYELKMSQHIYYSLCSLTPFLK